MIKYKFTRIVLLFAIFISSLSCYRENVEKISSNVDAPFDIIQEEYAVYKTLLKDKRKSFIVLYGSPDEAFGVNREFFAEQFSELQTDTLDAYLKRNQNTLSIDKQPVDFDYPVIGKIDSEKKLEKESQYYEFSRVGFSKNGKQAFVHFSDVCKVLCGKGAYYLLKKEENHWQVIKEVISWKS